MSLKTIYRKYLAVTLNRGFPSLFYFHWITSVIHNWRRNKYHREMRGAAKHIAPRTSPISAPPAFTTPSNQRQLVSNKNNYIGSVSLYTLRQLESNELFQQSIFIDRSCEDSISLLGWVAYLRAGSGFTRETQSAEREKNKVEVIWSIARLHTNRGNRPICKLINQLHYLLNSSWKRAVSKIHCHAKITENNWTNIGKADFNFRNEVPTKLFSEKAFRKALIGSLMMLRVTSFSISRWKNRPVN